MMMNIHKAALPPYYKGVDTLSRSLNHCLYVLVGSAGAPPCRTGVPRPELFYLIQLGYCILFNIDKWSTTFNYSKNPRYKFISDYINYSHFGFSICLPTVIILPQFCISMGCTNGSQMQHCFNLFIGDGTHLCLASDTRSRLIIKRSNARITGKFSPRIKTSEVIGIYNQIRRYNKANTFNASNQLIRGP